VKQDIEIIDSKTGELLTAELESIVLASKTKRVNAVMVMSFKEESYPTLLSWLEGLIDVERNSRFKK
jgi:hypothetical protein